MGIGELPLLAALGLFEKSTLRIRAAWTSELAGLPGAIAVLLQFIKLTLGHRPLGREHYHDVGAPRASCTLGGNGPGGDEIAFPWRGF